MDFIGYLLAVLIGISLGLVGSGGSILTVPVLVYVMGISASTATAYSLFVVGLTALFGAYQYAKDKLLDYKTAFSFGIPSIIAVYLTRRFIFPAIPETIAHWGDKPISKDLMLMVLFGLLMVGAAWSMIRKSSPAHESGRRSGNAFVFSILEGMIVGFITGMVGAGGGFLIIPALVLFAGLPMKQAVGTSLLIIAAKSLIGFLGDLHHLTLDFQLLAWFSIAAIAGIFIGFAVSKKLDGEQLKPMFGWFILAMAIFIIFKETVNF